MHGVSRHARIRFRISSQARRDPDKLNFGLEHGSLGGAHAHSYAGSRRGGVYSGTPQGRRPAWREIDFVVRTCRRTQGTSRRQAAYACGTARPDGDLPEAPTMIELGYPDFVLYSWNGVHGPPGRAAEIVCSSEQGDPTPSQHQNAGGRLSTGRASGASWRHVAKE